MKTEKRIHKIYEEYLEAKKKSLNFPLIVGKYQYIFSNSNGEISMINELRGYNNSPDFWEIYCLKGNLFEDTERFSTKEKAIKRVKEYLDEDELSELIDKKLGLMKNETK